MTHRQVPRGTLDDLRILRPVELRIAFVANHLPPSHWLTTEDTIFVRITLQLGPEYRDEPVPIQSGTLTGTVRYEGVPLWAKSEREPGVYEGSFWGTADPRSSIVIAFAEGRPGSSEFFSVALRPAEGLPTWSVQWFESGNPAVMILGVALVEQ